MSSQEFDPEIIVQSLKKVLSKGSFETNKDSDFTDLNQPFKEISGLPPNLKATFANHILLYNTDILFLIDKLLTNSPNEVLISTLCEWFNQWATQDVEELTEIAYAFYPTLVYLLLSNSENEYISSIQALFIYIYQNTKLRGESYEYKYPNLNVPSIYHTLLPSQNIDLHDKYTQTLQNLVIESPKYPDITVINNENLSFIISVLFEKFFNYMHKIPFLMHHFLDLWISITSTFNLDDSYQKPLPKYYPIPSAIPYLSSGLLENASKGLSYIANSESLDPVIRSNSKMCLKRIVDYTLINNDSYFNINLYLMFEQLHLSQNKK